MKASWLYNFRERLTHEIQHLLWKLKIKNYCHVCDEIYYVNDRSHRSHTCLGLWRLTK